MAKAPVVGAAHRSRRSRTSNLFRSDRVAAYIMLAPTIISFILFIGGPMLVGFGLTFFQWDALSSSKFVGLDNYRTLVHDPLVGTTLWNTFSFVVPDIALKLGLGIVLAALVDRFVVGPLKLGFRVVVFFPVIVSGVAVSLIWSFLLNTDLGLINYYLGQLNVSPIGWLDTSTTAMRSLVMVDVWRNIGFYFVVLTAGLQGISRQYYEAAAIDGASELEQFFQITIPMLSPSIFFLLIIGLIDGFQFFDLPYIMTNGGPGDATRTLVYYIYDTTFHFFRFGYGSTVAMLLFVIIGASTFIQMKFSNRWVFYG